MNPAIAHEMVDGALYQDEVDALKIQGVPSVFADGKLLHVAVVNLANCLPSWKNNMVLTKPKRMQR